MAHNGSEEQQEARDDKPWRRRREARRQPGKGSRMGQRAKGVEEAVGGRVLCGPAGGGGEEAGGGVGSGRSKEEKNRERGS